MGLKKSNTETETSIVVSSNQRDNDRDYHGLLEGLKSTDEIKRRWSARDLSAYPEAVNSLLQAIENEDKIPVLEAIFDSLNMIGGESVVSGLIPLLRSESALIRNSAISVLQLMPEAVALHIIELLNDRDSDVRIFAIDILQQLAHPQTPQWLLSVLKDETHINVVATAVDRLAEVGTPEMVTDLEALLDKFPNEPYLTFAVNTAIERIKEG